MVVNLNLSYHGQLSLAFGKELIRLENSNAGILFVTSQGLLTQALYFYLSLVSNELHLCLIMTTGKMPP